MDGGCLDIVRSARLRAAGRRKRPRPQCVEGQGDVEELDAFRYDEQEMTLTRKPRYEEQVESGTDARP